MSMRSPLLGLVAAALVACGGGDGGTDESAAGDAGDGAGTGAVVPVEAPAGPVDEELAERGERLFNEKGCVGCHTIGKGRLTGPDLAGVHERRSFEYFYLQVTNPDSMTRNDPVARQLLNEYMTPMPDLGIRPDEARALYEHVRAESAEAAEDERDERDESES